jgi:hypothetical protein
VAANWSGFRYVLLHSLSHALINELSVEFGYSPASLQERIYAREPGLQGGPAMTKTLTEFAEALASIVSRMPAGHVQTLAAAVAGAKSPGPSVAAGALSALANPVYRQHADQLLACWHQLPAMSGQAFGLALLSALAMREVERDSETVEAVATGPSTSHVSLRHTKAVVLDLISHAAEHLLIVSFAAYKVPDVVQALGEAAGRGIVVRMVLETTEDSAGALTHDGSKAFSGLGDGVEFYIWPSDRRHLACESRRRRRQSRVHQQREPDRQRTGP